MSVRPSLIATDPTRLICTTDEGGFHAIGGAKPTRGILAMSDSADKRLIVGDRVDSKGRLVCHTYENRMTGVQDPQLFEFFDLFEDGLRHLGNF